MGQEAETLEEGIETTEQEVDATVEQTTEGDETNDSETKANDSSGETEKEEVEIVLEGAGSPPKDSKFSPKLKRRLGKLTGERNSAKDETAAVKTELELEREKSKLKDLQIEQLKTKDQPTQEPNPDDFDGGDLDPEYRKKVREFDKAEVKREMAQEMAKSSQATVTNETQRQQSQRLADNIDNHYKRAAEVAPKDFEEVEGKAIEEIGQENVLHIVGLSDESEKIVYYLGKNPQAAQELKTLFEVDPAKAVARIGRLEATLSFKPKQKITPDPDREIEGGTASSSSYGGPPGATYE